MSVDETHPVDAVKLGENEEIERVQEREKVALVRLMLCRSKISVHDTVCINLL